MITISLQILCTKRDFNECVVQFESKPVVQTSTNHSTVLAHGFPYLSCTCGWGASSAGLYAGGFSEPCVDPGQTW